MKAEVLAYRAKVDRMDDKQRAKHDDDWSVANQGHHYGWYPALPYHACYPDMLHMALNQFNDATLERRMISAVVNRRSRPTSSLYDKLTVSSVKYGAGAGCIDS